jgi:hypothetical protein
MNKGFKGILISGAVALLVGIALVVAGIAAGASWSDVGSVFFSGKYSIGPDWNWGAGTTEIIDSDKLVGESHILKDIDANSIENLTIKMAAGRLDIKEGDSKYFQIVNRENRGDCYIKQDGNDLTIIIRGKRGSSMGAITTFWIPQGLEVANLAIHTDAGQVQTENLNAQELKMSVGAGQIRTEAINANKVDIEVDAGEFKGNGKITANQATLKVNAGNLKVDLLEAKNAAVNVDVGHIGIKFTGAQKDYNIDADVDVGEIKIGNEKYHLGKEYKSQNSSVDKTIEVDCSVGQATIDFEN